MTKKKKILLIILIAFLVGIASIYFVFQDEISRVIEVYSFVRKFDKDAFTKEYSDNYIYKNQKNLDVLRYDLTINIDFQKETIDGITKITGIRRDKHLTEIPFNLREGFNIISVKYNNNKPKFTYGNSHIIIPATDKADTFNISIHYKGKPKNTGMGSFVFTEYNSSKYLYTINEPVYASSWFPCNDIPNDKAFFTINITANSSKTSVSNGKLIDVRKKGKTKTYIWKTFYPIATYLVCIYSGKYSEIKDSVRIGNKFLELQNFVFPEDSNFAVKDLAINKSGLKIFSSLFGEYPFIKEKYGVAEINWPLGGIENQTISGIGKRFFTGEGFFDDLFIHELAHQWWGNAVTLSNWNEIWLNEGFAVYSTALFNEKLYGRASLKSFMNSKRGTFENATLEDPGTEALSNITYNKGAWFLHMLRNKLGDNKFFVLLKKYFEKFKYKNTSTRKFKELAEIVSGENLDYFFNQWLNKKGIPIFNISFSSIKSSPKGYTTNLSLTQMGLFRNYRLLLPVLLINKRTRRNIADTIKVVSSSDTLSKLTPFLVDSISVDPGNDLLLKAEIKRK
jgi:aminopeptidase N